MSIGCGESFSSSTPSVKRDDKCVRHKIWNKSFISVLLSSIQMPKYAYPSTPSQKLFLFLSISYPGRDWTWSLSSFSVLSFCQIQPTLQYYTTLHPAPGRKTETNATIRYSTRHFILVSLVKNWYPLACIYTKLEDSNWLISAKNWRNKKVIFLSIENGGILKRMVMHRKKERGEHKSVSVYWRRTLKREHLFWFLRKMAFFCSYLIAFWLRICMCTVEHSGWEK